MVDKPDKVEGVVRRKVDDQNSREGLRFCEEGKESYIKSLGSIEKEVEEFKHPSKLMSSSKKETLVAKLLKAAIELSIYLSIYLVVSC